MRQLFISDLHLQTLSAPVTERFWAFLEQIAPAADQLYILGDFFEYWIGDDHSDPLSDAVAEKLQHLSQNHQVKVFFMVGNRDFLLGEAYCQRAGMTLIPDPYLLPDNPSILLSHGDAQCTSDSDYQTVRQMLRSPQWQQNFLSKSIPERIAFAEQARSQSQEHQTGYALTDLCESAIIADLEQHQATFLIHGHTHQPGIRTISNSRFQRLTLSDWDHEVFYAEIIDNSAPKLMSFAQKT